jgi:putative ABC transport system permease protein
MMRHVFKLVWNRKRSTGLILVEILACFLVLCGILAAGLNLAIEGSRPLGFDYENVWSVEISGMKYNAEDEELAAERRALSDLLRVVRVMPQVEAVAVSTNTPYSGSTSISTTDVAKGKSVTFLWTLSSEDLPQVLRMELLHGRWLEATDAALGYEAVVITRNLAREVFGTENPVGKDIPSYDEEGESETPEEEAEIQRVVGVTDDYRRSGMMEDWPNTMFIGVDLVSGEHLPHEMLIRVRPGTTAVFEEQLVRELQSIAPSWSYDTTLLESRRHSMRMVHIMPLILSSVVAVFLIIMVGLGLVGVLWLSVTRRTAELGLRRAMGASGVSVRRQVVGELWALTAIAVFVGAVIFLQLPLFGANFGAGWLVFLGGVILATVLIYAFVTFCGLYPAWLATRVQPATALQYE